jgi:hypothetical protein
MIQARRPAVCDFSPRPPRDLIRRTFCTGGMSMGGAAGVAPPIFYAGRELKIKHAGFAEIVYDPACHES